MQFSYFLPWWIALPALLVLAAWTLIWYFRLGDTIQQRTRSILVGLRLLAILVLLFCLLAPALTSQEQLYPTSHLLVLLDQSESMDITDSAADKAASTTSPLSRFDRARQMLTDSLEELRERFEVHLYTFGRTASPVTELGDLQPDRLSTDLPASLDSAVKEWRGQSIGGILVLTDGQNTEPTPLPTDLKSSVYAVGFGSAQPRKDLRLGRVSVPPVTYAEHPLEISLPLQHNALDGERVPVKLMEGSRSLATQVVTLDQQDQTVRFQITPEQPGYYTYMVEVPPVPDELTTTNNVQHFSLKVIQARLRVLYVEGTPRWESRFLKRALETDPNLEFTFALLSRLPQRRWTQTRLTQTKGYYPDEGATKRLPDTLEQLRPYDVLIFGDVAPQNLSNAQMTAIQEFVETVGKSVVFLAGPASFGRTGWAQTSLAELVPAQFAATGAQPVAVEFSPRLTVEGVYHPLTQLTDNAQQGWADLPSFSSLYLGLTPRAGTVVLAEHQMRQQTLPVIAYQRYGRGKSLLIATDTLWNWAFQGRMFGQDDTAYRRFWSQTVRWLATRSDAKRINLSTDKGVYELNEQAEVQVRTYDTNYSPASVAGFELTLTAPNGKQQRLSPNERDTGVYDMQVRLTEPGTYRATITEPTLGSDSVEWLVQIPSVEYEAVELNEPWLRSLTETTKGQYASEAESAALLDQIRPSGEPITLTHTEPLWDNYWLFLLALALLGAEWFIRKQNGLV